MRGRLTAMRAAGFGLKEALLLDNRPKPWPNSGFQFIAWARKAAILILKFPAANVARTFLPVATGELSVHSNQRIYEVLTDNIQPCLNGSKSPRGSISHSAPVWIFRGGNVMADPLRRAASCRS